MKKKIFAITVSVLTFLSSLGWASELEKDELNEVVAFAKYWWVDLSMIIGW